MRMAVRDELDKLFEDYLIAYRQADADGCAAVYSVEAQLFSPFGSATGRKAIAELHRDWFTEGTENKSLTVLDSGQSGNLAWCLASFSEGEAAENGVSLNVLERQANGTWLIQMSILNES